jgi:hypothetical protein
MIGDVVDLEGEPVDHVDHAVQAADQADGDRDQAPALQLAGEGDNPVADVDHDGVRVYPHGPPEHLLADLPGDVGVGAKEDLEQIGPADDAEHAPVGVQDREGADPAPGDQRGNVLEGRMLVDGDDIAGHDISYAASHRPSSPPATRLRWRSPPGSPWGRVAGRAERPSHLGVRRPMRRIGTVARLRSQRAHARSPTSAKETV